MFPRIHDLNTAPTTTQVGWKGRSEAAKAKIDAANDPVRLAITVFRSRMRDLGEARNMAEAEYADAHAPVPSPIPAMVHRDVSEILTRFLTASGLDNADLLSPLKDHERVEAIEERHRARLQADLEEARAALVRVERQEALDRLTEAQKALAAVEASHARPLPETEIEAPVEALVNVPSLDQINKALAEQESVSPAVEDAPKRRGRPPRVSLDPNAGNEALPVA